jgi:hypothetical protein
MTAFAATNPAYLRRWAISAALVVLVHGAIVAAVVTWRNVIIPPQPSGPVVIDLAPMPAAPATDQAALPPAPAQVPSTASPDKTPGKVEEKTAARGEEEAEPSQLGQSPRVTPPVTLAPPENAEGENRADTKAVPSDSAPVQAGGGGPIDTRIAEQPRFKKDGKTNARKKTTMRRPSNMARPLKNFAGRQQLSGPGVAGGMARDAVGMPMRDRAGAASANGVNAADGAKNAVGAMTMNAVGGAATNAANGNATNAIGVSGAVHLNATGTNGQRGIVPVASNGAMSPNTVFKGTGRGINGTAMGRPGSGTSAIGGAAKNVAGVINGTSFRPKP